MCKRQTITAFSIINRHHISSYMIWKFSCQVGVSKYPLTSLKILKKLLTKKKIHLQKKRGGGSFSMADIFRKRKIDDFPSWVWFSNSFAIKNEMPQNFHSNSMTVFSKNQDKFQKYILIAGLQ